MARRSRVSYATPHNHHAMQTQITMRDLRRHLGNDHDDTLNAVLINPFAELVARHRSLHHGAAPDYVELPMNAKPEF